MTDHAQLVRIAKYGPNPGIREDLLARIGNLQRRRVIYQAYSARRSARSVRLASGWRLFRDGGRRTRCAIWDARPPRESSRKTRADSAGRASGCGPSARKGRPSRADSGLAGASRAARSCCSPILRRRARDRGSAASSPG